MEEKKSCLVWKHGLLVRDPACYATFIIPTTAELHSAAFMTDVVRGFEGALTTVFGRKNWTYLPPPSMTHTTYDVDEDGTLFTKSTTHTLTKWECGVHMVDLWHAAKHEGAGNAVVLQRLFEPTLRIFHAKRCGYTKHLPVTTDMPVEFDMDALIAKIVVWGCCCDYVKQ